VYSSDFIKIETINKYSLLYTVTGSESGNRLPYLLAAHMDVVPASPDTWEIPPFSGSIVNETYIYGRGAIDDKGAVLVSIFAI
jgi:carboxypeptidase PM20D1